MGKKRGVRTQEASTETSSQHSGSLSATLVVQENVFQHYVTIFKKKDGNAVQEP